jgi:hypothetical protein
VVPEEESGARTGSTVSMDWIRFCASAGTHFGIENVPTFKTGGKDVR